MSLIYCIAVFVIGFIVGAVLMNRKCARDIENTYKDIFPNIDFKNALKNKKPLKYKSKI